MGAAARPAAPAFAPALPAAVADVLPDERTILYSTSRQRQSQRLTDLYFNPPLERVGMLQWERFDSIVEQGRAHGAEVLDAMAGPALQAFRPHAV